MKISRSPVTWGAILWGLAIAIFFIFQACDRQPVDPMRDFTTTGKPYIVPEDHDWTDFYVQCVYPKREDG